MTSSVNPSRPPPTCRRPPGRCRSPRCRCAPSPARGLAGQRVLAPVDSVCSRPGHRGLAEIYQRRPFPVTAGDFVLAVQPRLPARRWSCWLAPPPPRPARARPDGGAHRLPQLSAASSSALIAEISASTASACSPRRSSGAPPRQRAGTYRAGRAAGAGEVGVRAVRRAVGAPAAGLPHRRPARQRAGQHRSTSPSRAAAARRAQQLRWTAPKIVLVCIHHTREAVGSVNNPRAVRRAPDPHHTRAASPSPAPRISTTPTTKLSARRFT